MADVVSRDWHEADLPVQDEALCLFAEKLTSEPASMQEADLQGLRDVGLEDVAIHDAIQVVSYFNYINRVADAVRVELEPEMAPYPEDRA